MPHVRASRLRLQFGPLLSLVAICLLAAGCGDSKHGRLLSTQQASELRGTLSQVQQDVAASNCTGAEQQVAALQDQIDGIKRLDRNLRSALRSSTRRLETLVSEKCQATPTTPTTTTPTTPDEGTTGATGPTGDEGKKPKKEKPPKKTPPGKDEQGPSGQQDGGGGAGLPGESNSNGNGGD